MDYHSEFNNKDDSADISVISSINDSCSLIDSIADNSFSSYSKVKVLGRGAFGEAALYRKTATNELVVWKEINLQRASDSERNNALNEVEILSSLDHINVVAYYNDFFDGSSLYIEMEYANDGSLHQKIIGQNGRLFAEEEILNYIYQVLLALAYIHSYGILHRDIKTLNIFLTKGKIVKVGDFGISKVLQETNSVAETCVGTPYYMSPELVKGEPYNQKSDIWACGCVLYELMTLQKVFDASNQLKLICSILEKDPENVDIRYSDEICNIYKRMLDKNSGNRPKAEELCSLDIFKNAGKTHPKLKLLESPLRRLSSQRSLSQMSSTGLKPVVSTLTSDVFYWGGGKLIPQKQELFSDSYTALQVSAGFSHFAVISIEKELFTWANIQGGTEIMGQLGHGNKAMYRVPKKVLFFDGIPVKQVACGEDFTVVLTDSGDVFACGSDYYGCIGCNNSMGDYVLRPVIIEALKGIDIKSIACGDSHVIALTSNEKVYSWGCGEYGRLGLGNEDDYSTPQLVQLPPRHSFISQITCGRDNTFMLTSKGTLLAFGNNEDNKMGLNQTFRVNNNGLTDENIMHFSLNPTPVKALRSHKLVFITSGKSHSAAIDEFDRLLTFGSNEYGQLGVGDYKPRQGLCLVRGALAGKEVTLCSCGDGFTIAATKDNHLYAWGLAENGRLGVDSIGKSNSPFPKTIFSSLHKVSSLCSRYWNTIILAEQVLHSKVINTQRLSISDTNMEKKIPVGTNNKINSMEDSTGSFQFVNELKQYDDSFEVNGHSGNTGNKNTNNMNSSINHNTMPTWLADELEDAEYIPMESEDDDESRRHSFRKSFTSSTETNSCCKCLEKEPSYLEVRVIELEVENVRLLKKIKEQEVLIKTLQRERDCYMRCSTKLIQLTEDEII